MSCDLDVLRQVPLFSLLDDDERAVLASQVEVREYKPRETIFRIGDTGASGYVLVEGRVRVTIIDKDEQEVTLDDVEAGGFFGFASLLEGTPHQATAIAEEHCKCLIVDRADLRHLIGSKPDAGMDMLAMFGRQFHAAQKLVQLRALRDPNDIIDRNLTFGERIADKVASFGGSWRFIIIFGVVMVVYTFWNSTQPAPRAWDPYPFILLNLLFVMLGDGEEGPDVGTDRQAIGRIPTSGGQRSGKPFAAGQEHEVGPVGRLRRMLCRRTQRQAGQERTQSRRQRFHMRLGQCSAR